MPADVIINFSKWGGCNLLPFDTHPFARFSIRSFTPTKIMFDPFCSLALVSLTSYVFIQHFNCVVECLLANANRKSYYILLGCNRTNTNTNVQCKHVCGSGVRNERARLTKFQQHWTLATMSIEQSTSQAHIDRNFSEAKKIKRILKMWQGENRIKKKNGEKFAPIRTFRTTQCTWTLAFFIRLDS